VAVSKYTTGEIAKLCGVSVRTVQYYDERGILVPGELSEGGRRLYSEEDLRRMRVICFLRSVGISINGIAHLLAEEGSEDVITTLLDQQEAALRAELAERQTKLELLEGVRRELRGIERFSVEAIGDVAHVVQQKRELKKLRLLLTLTGLPITALQWLAVIFWITHGLWWLFPIYLAAAVPWGIWLSRYYFRRVAYICPACHRVFHPRLKEVFWAYHTPKMRRLTCPECGRRGMCVEVYDEQNSETEEI
jgi:DNA-binding transcriptional MerR regulator